MSLKGIYSGTNMYKLTNTQKISRFSNAKEFCISYNDDMWKLLYYGFVKDFLTRTQKRSQEDFMFQVYMLCHQLNQKILNW